MPGWSNQGEGVGRVPGADKLWIFHIYDRFPLIRPYYSKPLFLGGVRWGGHWLTSHEYYWKHFGTVSITYHLRMGIFIIHVKVFQFTNHLHVELPSRSLTARP